ncbi:MAG TPA: ATPase [Bacteroidia bacterium]|nr:ATPase [Bacteroidia bacterium]
MYGKIASGIDFTNREKETTQLLQNFHVGINTILISPRRWGKSSLVKKVTEHPRNKSKNIRYCFIDLFNIRTEQEFYEAYIKELLKVTATKWEERIAHAKKLFKKIIPQFTIGLNPDNEFSVGIDIKEIKKAPEEILNLAETICKAKKIKLVVCIDEFQNISFFDDPLGFQKKLRAHWQHHKQTSYCLYGSKRHLLMELFSSPSMPFYKFGDVIFLEKIKEQYWVSFIKKRFRETGKNIEPQQAAKIAQLMENHPYFVQQLAQQAWLVTKKTCTNKDIERAVENLWSHNAILFQRETDSLTNSQLNFLKAMCHNVKQFSSAETIVNYKLGTSANVIRIKEALENKEIIDTINPAPEFMDPLFKTWLTNVYFKP